MIDLLVFYGGLKIKEYKYLLISSLERKSSKIYLFPNSLKSKSDKVVKSRVESLALFIEVSSPAL